MGRRAHWPPAVTVDRRTNLARVRYLGKTHYLGRAGTPQARAAYAELLRTLAPARGDERPLTVGDGVHLWLAHAAGRYAGSLEAQEYGWALAPVLELFAALPIGEFDAAKLEEVRDRMVQADLCRNVANRRVVRVRTAWRWLERRGHAPRGSWAGLRALEPLGPADRSARRTEPVRPATWDAVQAVLPHLSDAARGLLLLLWHTGARPSELFALEAHHIDRSGPVWTARVERHKCAWRGQERVIVFGPESQEILRPRLDTAGPLFRNSRGNAYDSRSFYLAVRRAARRAGVRLHPYQCRHAAKQRITRTLSLDHARALLGQKSLSTTDLYAAGQDLSLATEAARRVG